MRLNPTTDHAVRILIYLSIHEGRPVLSEEVARAYGTSPAAITRAMDTLEELGLVRAEEGGGGFHMAAAPSEIPLGWLTRNTEAGLPPAECFEAATCACPIAPACMLKNIFAEARQRFLDTLERYTLEDCLASPRRQQAFLRMWDRQAGEARMGLEAARAT